MECPQCGRRVEPGDRFCNGCGTSLEAVSDTTQAAATVDDAGEAPQPDASPRSDDGVTGEPDLARTELMTIVTGDDDTGDESWSEEPSWAPTGSLKATGPDTEADRESAAASVETSDLPATEPITEVWMERVADQPPPTTPYDFTVREPVAITGELDAQAGATATMPVVPAGTASPASRFGFNLILLISIVSAVVALVAMFGNMLTITSDTRLVQTDDTPPDFRTGTWILDDLADNMSIAGLIAIATMVAGGVASGFRWRWGSGLAGGAGLALAGLAALGVVLFFASINDAFGDRRAGLNPWIAALGALAIVVTAAGPLLPENQAMFSDNWYLVEGVGEASALLLVGRLVQLGLFVLGGVIGFLSVRRWGLGLAVGAALPGVWLVVSTLLDVTDDPVGLGFRNPGADDMHVHGVTIIGTSAVLAMIVLSVVAAYDQGVRERR